ncbi:MAG: hypothetical protein HYX78_11175 [Armatimonadetes bacterium]|nr:hypothetical protein [Armatimonadota bacterium]
MFWSETVERWKTEGLPADVNVEDHFGSDIAILPWPDLSLRFPVEVIEDTDEYIVQWDANGVLRKDFKRESGHTPHWLEYKLNSSEDWWAHKDRLQPSSDRIPEDMREQYELLRSKGKFIVFSCIESYELAWNAFGQVGIFTMMMDQPEVVQDIFDTYANTLIGLAQTALDQGIDFDGAWFFGDVGYRNSTLFSPACYNELLFPAHQKLCGFFNSLGKPVLLHSCGKIESLIPRFIEAGFSAIQPLEAKCGQDVRVLKEMYGDKITLFGNIDVRKLSGTKEDIEEEIESKLPVAAKGGRYIFHSDHSVPPTVSYDNYCYAVELSEKYGKY